MSRSVKRYEGKGKRWKEITDGVTYYIAKDSLPIYTIEKPGFKKILVTVARIVLGWRRIMQLVEPVVV